MGKLLLYCGIRIQHRTMSIHMEKPLENMGVLLTRTQGSFIRLILDVKVILSERSIGMK